MALVAMGHASSTTPMLQAFYYQLVPTIIYHLSFPALFPRARQGWNRRRGDQAMT